jgi:AraC-like DNA-binding protein
MKKYKDFSRIRKQEISEFYGLENEVTFSPYKSVRIRPLTLSKFGITYPDSSYFIKREPSPCFIIEYILSGHGYLEINGEKYKLNPGDAYIIHPGDFCTYYADKNDPYKKYWVNFAADFFFTDMLKGYDIEDRVFRGIDLTGFFDDLFKLEEISDTNDNLFIPASKLIFGVIMDIASHKETETGASSRNIAFKVRNILCASLSTHITIDDVAKKLYRSKNDINRQFKKQYDKTPHNFLIEMRIGKAKNMLVNSRKTIAEIANFLCFSSEFHFSNTFKKKVGISPSEFRKNMSKRKNSRE